MLPRWVPAERPWARLRVRVYRAEGLPALRPGLLGSLAHALLGQRVPVDPYVRMSFLGRQVSPSHPHSVEAQAQILTDHSPPVFVQRSGRDVGEQ